MTWTGCLRLSVLCDRKATASTDKTKPRMLTIHPFAEADDDIGALTKLSPPGD
jgi:hypothetical protein